MRKYKFLVVLKGMSMSVYSFTKGEAVILAQAEAIKSGLDYSFISVTQVSSKEYDVWKNK